MTVLLRLVMLTVLSGNLFCQTSPSEYRSVVASIKSVQDSLSQCYLRSDSSQKIKLIAETENFLYNTYYHKIVPAWLGTKWEFYGETQIPQDSSIACGHFVVTTLRHLGFNLESHHEMATNYSAYMVNSLCDSVMKTHQTAAILQHVKSSSDDFWVVGLHNHSGLLFKQDSTIRFIHSSYTAPAMVVNENAMESDIFMYSKIYVAGNLFKNNSLVVNWLTQTPVTYSKTW